MGSLRTSHFFPSPLVGEGGGPAPRRVQDSAPNLTWFRGEGEQDKERILGVFDFLKGREPKDRDKSQLSIEMENRTYDELIDEIMKWNIEQTDILSVLKSEIEVGRLATWSRALEVGIRKGLGSPSGKIEESPFFAAFLDLHKFVTSLRQKLLTNPTMKNVWKMEKSDSLCVCILSGIRALQRESEAKRLLNTLHWILLERYLG